MIHDGIPNQTVHLYKIHAEVIRDLRDKFSPAHTENPESGVADDFLYSEPFGWALVGEGLLDADSVIGAFAFRQLPFTIPDRERNPYPTNIQAVDLDEQQRTLRDQHNRTQAGDSTFDYGLLLKPTPDRLYTLGSVGRFYHESFGIIVARYVRFKSCIDTAQQGAPCGYLKTSRRVDWVVTNDLSKSGKDQVVGVMCLAETPADDTYGWVVTDGPVPVMLTQATSVVPAPDTPYVWSATGEVSIGVSGKIIGRRWGKATTPLLEGGTFYVRLEGMSPQWFVELVAAEFAETADAIAEHENRIGAVEDAVDGLAATLGVSQAEIGQLEILIGRESAARSRDIQSVRVLAEGVDWSSQILESANLLREEFSAADDSIRVTASNAEYTANLALSQLSGLDTDLISSRLTGMDSQLSSLTGRLNGLAINDLADVDTITTPPLNGQSLTWDSTLNVWKPATVVGGGGGGSGLIGEVIATGAETVLSIAIPPGYKKLRFDVVGRGSQNNVTIRLNGDTSLLYDNVRAFWSNTGASGFDGSSSVSGVRPTLTANGGTAPAPIFMSGEIVNPSDAQEKQILWRGKQLVNATGTQFYQVHGTSAWRSSAVVNAVAVVCESTPAATPGTWTAGTVFRVYGET